VPDLDRCDEHCAAVLELEGDVGGQGRGERQ
jgi:hypothetical protein